MMGGCFVSSAEGSASPLVWAISVGPLVAVFSIMGIRSNKAGLKVCQKDEVMWSEIVNEPLLSLMISFLGAHLA